MGKGLINPTENQRVPIPTADIRERLERAMPKLVSTARYGATPRPPRAELIERGYYGALLQIIHWQPALFVAAYTHNGGWLGILEVLAGTMARPSVARGDMPFPLDRRTVYVALQECLRFARLGWQLARCTRPEHYYIHPPHRGRARVDCPLHAGAAQQARWRAWRGESEKEARRQRERHGGRWRKHPRRRRRRY